MVILGYGHVWDVEERNIKSFVNGKYETEDERLIKLFAKAGFTDSPVETPKVKQTGDVYYAETIEPEEKEVSPAQTEWTELQGKAKSLGIKIKGMNKVQLKREIAKMEAGKSNVEPENENNVDR